MSSPTVTRDPSPWTDRTFTGQIYINSSAIDQIAGYLRNCREMFDEFQKKQKQFYGASGGENWINNELPDASKNSVVVPQNTA